MVKNAFYAQSGGVTAVINATACGLLEAARLHSDKIGKVFAGKNGIIGALNEELIDTSQIPDNIITQLKHTPAGAFGSCRYKLKSLEHNRAEYERLIEVFEAHNIGYFFYNGGGDSQDTANKVSQLSKKMGFSIQCIGIPKTVDNDLPITDCCPGFGSVAKYVAVSILEASLDVASMCATSTKVFILEVMGRHAGWIAASGGLAQQHNHSAPHIILFPERAFEKDNFLTKVKHTVERYGFCSIVVSEGVKDSAGNFLADAGTKDAFGHTQLGGAAPALAQIIKSHLGFKYHWAVADYLQRSARHIASLTDVTQAYALGKAAIEFALEGKDAIMPIIVREQDSPYKWHIGEVALEKVANVERLVPDHFITEDGFGITEPARQYLQPLIEGEAYPPYQNGLPIYLELEHQCVTKKINKEPMVV